LIQASIFPPYDDGNLTTLHGLVNVTAESVLGQIELPYTYPNGSHVYLGDPGLGYPPALYPNLTYHGLPGDDDYYAEANGRRLDPNSVLIGGPVGLNNSSAILSATTGIMNNSSPTLEVLGWLTVIVNASMIFDVRDSMEGLGKTGEVLIIGPHAADNLFSFDIRDDNGTAVLDDQQVRFVLPPIDSPASQDRHSLRSGLLNFSTPFAASSFPAYVQAWTHKTGNINNAGAILDTRNEQDKRVSVGFAQVATPLVDWALLVEQAHSEVVEPINHLRDIVLICVFSVFVGLLLFTFPLAHYSVTPIRQLRAATQKTVEPYVPDDSRSGYTDSSNNIDENYNGEFNEEEARKEGFLTSVKKWASSSSSTPRRSTRSPGVRRTFRIPSKVPERRHLIYDELTDLTSKFNEMSDELAMQYQRLDERVRERTAQLEQSKQAAEAANQSKTLFIANISHELKTPLNGILGLAQICMNEDDPSKIKSTLNTIYKSGDLLLHLLTDLLTFSKNEVGQQLSIEESEFPLSDLSTQLIPTFDRQAKENQINLEVLYYGVSDSLGNSETDGEKHFGPVGTGRVQDMCLWGDKNRIMQVLMNFTSNALKFTPANGSVTVRVRCLGIYEPNVSSRAGSVRKSSLASTQRSRHSKSSSKRVRTSDTSLFGGSDSEDGKSKQSSLRPRFGSKQHSDSEETIKSKLRKRKPDDAKLFINLGGGKTQVDKVVERQRSKSPAPFNTKDLDFEFEVEDTGPGIPEDQQRKIFEPFVQGDLGLSKKYGGTGLGLSICAQLAALMGGELSLDSEVGRGSKFTMRIPLRYIAARPSSMDSSSNTVLSTQHMDRPAMQPTSSPSTDASGYVDVPRVLGLSQPFVAKEIARPQPMHSPSSDLKLMQKVEKEAKKQGSKVRVLVAEDNKVNQEVVLRMLKLEDVYDVTIAKDGQEAYDKVRESMQNDEHFHLVFMDVQMPNVDGIQSTKMIRGMGFSAPIVALTAFAEKSNEDECMASGMDYFLAKPIRRPALKQVLKKYCATIPEEEGSESSTPISPLTKVNGNGKAPKGTMTTVQEVTPGNDAASEPNPPNTDGSAAIDEEHSKGSVIEAGKQ